METGKKSSWSYAFLYIIIVALCLSMAYLANITIKLDKDCAVNMTVCASKIQNYSYNMLERDCAVNETKWDICRDNYEECQNKTNDHLATIKELQDKLDSMQTQCNQGLVKEISQLDNKYKASVETQVNNSEQKYGHKDGMS